MIPLALLGAALLPDLPPPPPGIPFLAPPRPDVAPPMLTLAPQAPSVPEAIRTMIVAAYKTGDDKTITAVVGLAKANFPLWLDQIEDLNAAQGKLLASARHDEQEKEQARIAAASFLQIWKGELEAGASRSTGSTRTVGLYASAKLNREGIHWTQKFNARIDYQETNKVATTERWLAAWQPSYKFNEVNYAYTLAQYEHDRFLGVQARETLGIGLGYQPLISPRFRISVEAGPALRITNYIEEPNRITIAGRGSLSAKWQLSPTVLISQDASVFVENPDVTASSVTSMETKLIGAIKARFSYNLQFERATPTTDRQLDTVTRATLVYSF